MNNKAIDNKLIFIGLYPQSKERNVFVSFICTNYSRGNSIEDRHAKRAQSDTIIEGETKKKNQ